jgi:hypothetical protein
MASREQAMRYFKARYVAPSNSLMVAAWTEPVSFVRVVASLMPKELEATTITVVHAERMSDDELAAIASQGGGDTFAEEEDER